VQAIEGQVLRENTTMISMCRDLGSGVEMDPDEISICIVKLPIAAHSAAVQGTSTAAP
jgi:acetyltransferase